MTNIKITKEGEEMVVRIPLFQDSYDACEELIGQVSSILGVINHTKDMENSDDDYECGFSYLIDLGYKGSQDEGEMFLHYDGDVESFENICKELRIPIWEHDCCAYCGKTLYGSFTLGDKGYQCWNCENSEEKEADKEINKPIDKYYEEISKDTI